MPCVTAEPTNLVHGSEVLLLDRVLQCEHVVLVVVPDKVLLLQKPRRFGGVNRSVLRRRLYRKSPLVVKVWGCWLLGYS
jgi:hypothetical protein